MQISTRHGFAFLSSPKCASTAIENSISNHCNITFTGNPALKHLDARVYSSSVLPLIKALVPQADLVSFSLVREPLEWIASWYRYRTRPALSEPVHPHHKNYTGHLSYDEFIEEYIKQDRRKPFANLLRQYDFVKSASGDVGVDLVLPVNRLDLIADFFSSKIGEKIKIPRRNISPKMNLTLDPDREQRLREYLKKDLVLYKLANLKDGYIPRRDGACLDALG